jgi:hypothetical protein
MKSGRVRTLKSAKYLERRRKKNIGLILISFSLFILSLILIYGALRIPFLQISTVVIKGVSSLNQQEMQNTVKGILNDNYFYVIPKTNFLFYPKAQILYTLQDNYKKIDKINASVDGSSTLNIEVYERIAEVVACEGFKEDEDDNICYFADNEGYIYEKMSTSDSSIFKYYVNPNIPVIIGKNFIESNKFKELQKFIKDLKSFGINSNGLLVSEDGSYELYILNKDQTVAVVYFDNRTSIDKTYSDLTLFWQNVIDMKIGYKNVPSFEYINLRFGNNVFYLVNENGNMTTNKDGNRVKK